MNGIEYLIGFLKEKNTDTVFSYPGSAITELYEALCLSDINNIVAAHEQGAVHAADGYARASGRVGVVVATSGPGAVNLVTGLCNAYLDSIPILAITGQVNTALIGHDAFQEADIMGITIPVTKHNFLVKNTDSLPTVLEEAWRIAVSGRPGPVLVDIPRDVMVGKVTAKADPKLPHKKRRSFPIESCAEKIYSLISESYRPIFLLGGGVVGCNGAPELFARVTDKFNIPAVYTLMGKTALDNTSPYCLGMAGVHGHKSANDALLKSDLVIAVGTRFSDRTVPVPERFGEARVVIHADIDDAELNKNVRSICPVTCSSDELARVLLDMEFAPEQLAHWKHWSEKCIQKSEILPRDSVDRVMGIIDRFCDGYTVVADVGSHQMSASRMCKAKGPRSFITSGGLGTMGFGLPAAIGVLFAKGEDAVLFCGDGSFQMTLNELSVLKGHKTAGSIKIFVIDNGSYGMVKEGSKLSEKDGKKVYSVAGSPDFELIAKAYGIDSESFETDNFTEEAARRIFASKEHKIVIIKEK